MQLVKDFVSKTTHLYRYAVALGMLGIAVTVVGRCRLNQVDSCPITYNLSNP
jgi:hypothetical protein